MRAGWKQDRIGSALRGRSPTVLRRLEAGFAVIFLHAHVWPRYEWEPPERAGWPVWLYPADRWGEEHALGPRHHPLRAAIAAGLDRLTAQAGGRPD